MALLTMFKKSAPQRELTDMPVQPDILYLSNDVGVALVQWNDRIAAHQALRHPVVYRALDKLAGSVQQVRWYAEEDPEASRADRSGNARYIQELNNLLRYPNCDMTAAQLRYWMGLNYSVYGRVPLKVGVSTLREGQPNGLYPLEAAHVYSKMNKRGIVDRYEYGTGEEKEEYLSHITWMTSRDSAGYADQIWKPGLKGYQHREDSNSPLQAIGLPAQVVKSLLVRAIKAAEGHPNARYLVTCSKALTEPQKKALKNHLSQYGAEGPASGTIPILQNATDLEIHKLDNDLSDIHSKAPSDDMARMIFSAFGIPVALAGMGSGADGAKYASNYTESRAAFWQDTVIPYYVSPLFQGLSKLICPPGVRVSYDEDTVPALRAGRVLAMKEASEITFLTNAEKRVLFGYAGDGGPPDTAPTTEANDGDQTA